ncbi:MAG: signal recognition particle subunit SRP19/SEC65 family protein [Nitrososphaerales archaeon]
MKDYKRLILWIDYFNSTMSRENGRRIPLDKSVKDPTIDELTEAASRLGYQPEPSAAKHPSRMMTPSGYVSIEKKSGAKKSQVISEVAKTMSLVRGEKSAAKEQAAKPQQKKR